MPCCVIVFPCWIIVLFCCVIVLLICFSTYLGRTFKRVKGYKEGFSGTIRTFSVIGDRLSPFVSCACVILAINNIFNRN